jgi:hypothetical protein
MEILMPWAVSSEFKGLKCSLKSNEAGFKAG